MRRALWTLAKGAMPAVTVSTLIPLLLFYSALLIGSVHWAIAASVTYAYALSVCQYLRRGRVSGMLLVTTFMATGRAVAVLATRHTGVYFAVPIFETAGFGLMFLVTMFSREPLVVRLARDLVPHAASDIARRDGLVRRLSLIWATVYVASGATTMVLLVAVPLPVYLGAHTLTGWCWTGSGLVASAVMCARSKTCLLASPARSVAPTLPAMPPLGVAPAFTALAA